MSKKNNVQKRTINSMIFIVILIILSIVVFLSFQDIRPDQKERSVIIEHEALE